MNLLGKRNFSTTSLRAVVVYTFFLLSCSQNPDKDIPMDTSSFGKRETLGNIENNQLQEASGIAVSRVYNGKIWAHNDSGDKARLFLFDEKGKDLGIFNFENLKMRDWEDMAIGTGPVDNVSYLFIAEFGDNQAKYDDKKIYRIREPDLASISFPAQETISSYATLHYRYADGARDAETLLADPITKDLYIISKREEQIGVYPFPYPQSTEKVTTLEKLCTLEFTNATAGSISPDGKSIVIKNYLSIFYWEKKDDETIGECLCNSPLKRIPYVKEPQGEAIDFAPDNKGFYTLSEERHGVEAILYYYPRLNK